MKNFLRALRCAWPYRGRLLLSIACALLAAVLWGLNFTAIYPVLKIIGSHQTLQDWVGGKLDETQKEIDKLQARIDDLEKQRKQQDNQPLTRMRDTLLRRNAEALSKLETKLESARKQLYWYSVAKRFIDSFFPPDCFQTLALVLGLVVLAVAIKGF